MPRPNGYQSLHTSVISESGTPFEVQIRTIEMHRMAEEGIAAHWKYKEGRIGDQRDERYFQWMRQLLEYQQEVRDPQEFMQNLKVELYPEEVYTFTPKGLVKAFPRGATPIDFGAQGPDDPFGPNGYGKLSGKQRLGRLVPNGQLQEKPPEGPVASVVKRGLGGGDEKIKVRGFGDLLVFRARCCNPIRGEKIIGYITRGKGVSVHSATCTNVVNLLYDPERKIDVEWDKGEDALPSTVRLSLQVEARKG